MKFHDEAGIRPAKGEKVTGTIIVDTAPSGG